MSGVISTKALSSPDVTYAVMFLSWQGALYVVVCLVGVKAVVGVVGSVSFSVVISGVVNLVVDDLAGVDKSM